jgi:hypothetical protein
MICAARRAARRRPPAHRPPTAFLPARQVLDAFAAASLATALAQLLYALLVGSFPFNAFLAGFFCCIGAAVLTGAPPQSAL